MTDHVSFDPEKTGESSQDLPLSAEQQRLIALRPDLAWAILDMECPVILGRDGTQSFKDGFGPIGPQAAQIHTEPVPRSES